MSNWFKKSMGLWEDVNRFGPTGKDHIPQDSQNSDENIIFNKFRKENEIVDDYYRRIEFTKNYAWAVPDQDSIQKIKQFVGNDKVLEIGSGTGLWAKLMQDIGIQITPTDANAGMIDQENDDQNIQHDNKYFETKKPNFTQVFRMNEVESVSKFKDHSVLMLCWPPYKDPMAANAIKVFAGNKLIYVGEGSGGCTGDDCLHTVLQKEWQIKERIEIPRWTGIHDRMYFYERKI